MRPGRASSLLVLLVAGAAARAEPPPPPPQPPPGISLEDGFAPVVARAAPAVVNVSSRLVEQARPDRPRDPFEFFGPFGFDMPDRPRVREGIGSGVIVSADGTILTNNHLVEGAARVEVSLADGREYDARVVGRDPPTDLAVLKIDATGLPYLPFGDSREVRVGDLALAVGNPFGLGQTVTQGIISAVGRGSVGISDYEDFLQTDAAINPGNSGGALVNARGELIGIPTAILSAGARGNQGIGFAIPSHMAQAVMAQILQHGRVIRGFLGVNIQDVTPALGRALGLPQAKGALVADVTPGSPAAAAGLKRGDVIVEVQGRPVTTASGLRNLVASTAPGTRLELGVLRDGNRQVVRATLAELPQEKLAGPAASPEGGLGLELTPLTADLARRLDVPATTRGVVVTGVEPDSPAADAGLVPGDIVEEVNRKPVASPKDLRAAVERSGKQPLLLRVRRQGSSLYVVVERR